MSRGRKPNPENFDFDSYEKNYFNEEVPIKKKKEQKMKLRKATWKRMVRMQHDILSIMETNKSLSETMRNIQMSFQCLQTKNQFDFSGPIKFTATIEPYKFEIPVNRILPEVQNDESNKEKESNLEKESHTEKEIKSDNDDKTDSENPFVVE